MANHGDTAYPWTDEQVSLLRRLWDEGLSASEIARRLKNPSRNSVIGKVHRIGLVPRQIRGERVDVPVKRPPKTRASAPPRVTTRIILAKLVCEPLPPQTDDVARVSLVDREPHQCCWPVGDPRSRDFGYCGLQIVSGLHYCPTHARRMWQPPATRTRVVATTSESTVQNPEKIEA